MSGPRRVIVGASGSPGNLGALRYAEHLARAYDAVLIPVHTWIPPGGDIAERHSPCLQLRSLWTDDAWERLWHAIDAAWWAFWHRTLTPDDVLRDGGVSGGGSRYA